MHLLQHLERFLSSFLSSKEFFAAFIGAVIGGLLTGRYSLRAQKQAAEDQRQRDQEAERRLVKGTLQAIAAELRVLKADCLIPLDTRLSDRARRNDPTPLAMTRTELNRVTIFESNAATLGKIDDADLREKIIRVYGLVKGLIDTLNSNARNFERWRALPNNHPERQIVAGMLADLEGGIRHGLADLQREVDEVLKRIEKYLNPLAPQDVAAEGESTK